MSLLGTNLCFPRFFTVVTAAQEIGAEPVACILKYFEPYCYVAQLWMVTNAKPLTGSGSSYKPNPEILRASLGTAGLLAPLWKKTSVEKTVLFDCRVTEIFANEELWGATTQGIFQRNKLGLCSQKKTQTFNKKHIKPESVCYMKQKLI